MKFANTYVYPLSTSNSELLPAPLGPITAVSSPARNSPFSPFKMVFVPIQHKERIIIY